MLQHTPVLQSSFYFDQTVIKAIATDKETSQLSIDARSYENGPIVALSTFDSIKNQPENKYTEFCRTADEKKCQVNSIFIITRFFTQLLSVLLHLFYYSPSKW